MGTQAAETGPTDEVGDAVARKGRARRFREARELKQGFDDGLFTEGERTAGRRRRRRRAELATTTTSTKTTTGTRTTRSGSTKAAVRPPDRRVRASGRARGSGRDRDRQSKRRIASATTSRFDVACAREAVEHRDHDVRRVDLEVAAQRGARVGEPEAVGAERHERLRARSGRSDRAPTFMKSVTATIGPSASPSCSVTYGTRGVVVSGAGGSTARRSSASSRSSL